MRRCRLLIFLLAGIFVSSIQAQGFLTNGLVAYYSFNGNANDASGYGNNGIGAWVVQATNRFGFADSAYRFDGSNAVVTIPSLSSISLPEITISAWVELFANPSVQADIVNKWRAYSYGLEDYAFTIQSDLRVNYSNGRRSAGYNELPNHCAILSSTKLTIGRWYHLAVTHDSLGIGKLWINGVLSAQDNILPLLPPASEPVRVGQMLFSSAAPFNGAILETFNGLIDDLRIYRRALPDDEVSQLYASESTPPCSPHKATATAVVVNGFVVGGTIANPGCGYTYPPTVLVQGGGGTGATATATIRGGEVVAINIISAGCCYTNIPTIVIGSPPFVPTVSIGVSKVKVTQTVVLGRTYVLESSGNLTNWTAIGPAFTADAETIVNEFDVEVTGQFFRIRQVAP